MNGSINMGIENILNKDKLIERINYNALFILNFESLKDFLIDKVRDFFTSKYEVKGGELVGIPDDKYNKEIRTLGKGSDDASLNWLKSMGAISEVEIDIYKKLKNIRDEITHEFYSTLYRPVEENDKMSLNTLISLFNKVDKWFINNLYVPSDESMINVDYDEKNVIGGQALLLSIINDAILNSDYSLIDEIYAVLNKHLNK